MPSKRHNLKYMGLNSNVYSYFLDASKAYDRVYIVRILIFWYTTKKMYVRWKNIMSNCSVTKGVRQGGILSPYLFCVYMDDLSNKLNNVNSGCIIGSSLINHLMYAGDLVLMAPSSMGLSVLLSLCSEYGIEHDIELNLN